MGLYDRDYVREPQGDDDVYVRRLTLSGIVRPRLRERAPGFVEHEIVVPADGTLWPEFEGLPVKRTIVLPRERTRIVASSARRTLPMPPARPVVLLALALFGYFVLPHLTGWRLLVW